MTADNPTPPQPWTTTHMPDVTPPWATTALYEVANRHPRLAAVTGAHFLRDTNQVDVGVMDRDVLGEGPPVGKPRLGLMVADLVISGVALRAGAAGTHEWDGHAIALFPSGDAFPRLLNDSCQLVPRHMREDTDVRIVTQPAMPIAATDPARLDADDYAIRIVGWIVHV